MPGVGGPAGWSKTGNPWCRVHGDDPAAEAGFTQVKLPSGEQAGQKKISWTAAVYGSEGG